MPKEILEINNFTSGTISTPSDTDIPDDAATWSINIDPVAEDGKLMSVEKDLILGEQGWGDYQSQIEASARKMEFLNRKDTEDLIFYNSEGEGGSIGSIRNINSSQPVTNVGTSNLPSTNSIAMASNNKEVHVGLGPAPTSEPRWAGYVEHNTIGGEKVAGIQVEKAICESAPSGLTGNIHKAVYVNDDVFAITWKSDSIFRGDLNSSTGVISNWAEWGTGFVELRSICVDNNDRLYVYDEDGPGKIKQIDISSFSIVATYTCGTGLHFPDEVELSDLHITQSNATITDGDVNFWVAGFRSPLSILGTKIEKNELDETIGLVFRSDDIANGDLAANISSVNWTNATPSLDSSHTTTGGWCKWTEYVELADEAPSEDIYTYFHQGLPDNFENYYSQTYRLSLCTIEDSVANGLDKIGWVVKLPEVESLINDEGQGVQFTEKWPVKIHNTTASATSVHGVGGTFDLSNGIVVHSLDVSTAAGDIRGGSLLKLESEEVSTFNSIATEIGTQDYIWIGYDDKLQYVAGYIDYSANDWTDKRVTGSTQDTDITQDTVAPFGFSGAGGGSSRIITFCPYNGSPRIDYWKAYNGGSDQGTHIKMNDLNSLFTLSISPSVGTAGFSDAKKYYYKYSLTYDGYQESPLSVSTASTDGSAAYSKIQVTFTINDVSSVPKRISHVNIYRAEGADTLSEPVGFYRLIKSVHISKFASVDGDAEIFDDYEPKIGASYEARTGISEAVTNTMVHYGLSTKLNGYLFVGDCWQRTLGNASNYIIRSKLGKFDMFNWVEDFLVLPSTPTAIASFQGRLYAFDKQNTYRIDPNNLVIEDTFEGVGCAGPDAVVVTEYGMCFADDTNIYLHDGSRPVAIGGAILTGETPIKEQEFVKNSFYDSWQKGRDKSFKPLVSFDGNRNSFLIFMKNSNSEQSIYVCWAFNIERKRWDLWDFNVTRDDVTDPTILTEIYNKPLSTLINDDGHILVSSGNKIIKYHGHPDEKRRFIWVSKKFTMGSSTQIKKIKNIILMTNGGTALSLNIPQVYRAWKDTDYSMINATIGDTEAEFTPFNDEMEDIPFPYLSKLEYKNRVKGEKYYNLQLVIDSGGGRCYIGIDSGGDIWHPTFVDSFSIIYKRKPAR